MGETIGVIGAIATAVLTLVAGMVAFMKDRSGLHHAEKLGVVIHSLKPSSPARKMLETIRDEQVTQWGLNHLGRSVRRKLRITYFTFWFSYVFLILWGLSSWAWVPDPPSWIGLAALGSWIGGVWLLLFRSDRLQKWETAERIRRQLPAKDLKF